MGYPVMLNIKHRLCVVIGGGNVAYKKVIGLLNGGANVVVISPQLNAYLIELVDESKITWHSQPYEYQLLASYRPFLVIAATNSADVNHAVAHDARSLCALVNVVDRDANDDFDNMAVIENLPLTIAISTGGAAPALAKHIGRRLSPFIGDEYSMLASWMDALRSDIQLQIPSEAARRDFWFHVLQSDVLTLLERGQKREAFDALQRLLSDRVEVAQ